ncbi:hypothetical protein ACG04R_16540 [Roseateles sp. BYS78W]|uniref:Uncharacterized protein n=1 Tax=Pelomonas candidula TaxID=3299025 RepID=A0ABW7HEF2_9BURK
MPNLTTDATSQDIKPVLVRFPLSMHERVQQHQARMSTSMGGARVTFQQAALHLMQSGADLHEEQAQA